VNKHDWELFDKQTQRLIPCRNDGVKGLSVVAMFFAGVALGALFTQQSEPMRSASNDASARVFLQNDALVVRDTDYYR